MSKKRPRCQRGLCYFSLPLLWYRKGCMLDPKLGLRNPVRGFDVTYTPPTLGLSWDDEVCGQCAVSA
jgi:hypothetical protein